MSTTAPLLLEETDEFTQRGSSRHGAATLPSPEGKTEMQTNIFINIIQLFKFYNKVLFFELFFDPPWGNGMMLAVVLYRPRITHELGILTSLKEKEIKPMIV